jgi:hypothetical protein
MSDPATLSAFLATAVTTARSRFVSDFGEDAFHRSRLPNGQTPGQAWGQYLAEAGFPRSFDDRREVARVLRSAGLDDAAETALIMSPASPAEIDHLLLGLKSVAVGTAKTKSSSLTEFTSARFVIIFDEKTPLWTTIATMQGLTYRPRSGDAITWKYSCSAAPISDISALRSSECSDPSFRLP